MIKILFLAANPSGTDPLALGRESHAIQERLRLARGRGRFRLEQDHAARLTELIDRIEWHAPAIVHFSGHGSEAGQLVFETDRGAPAPAPIQPLADVFGVLAARIGIRCVVLNACYSEEQARAISRHVDCVVGMGRAVRDDAAIQFASQLYSSLANGSSVQDGFALARTSLDLLGIPESDTPRLLVRPGADPDRLRLVDGRRSPGTRTKAGRPGVEQHIQGDHAVVAGRDMVVHVRSGRHEKG
jgi:hypothetical protein